MAASSSIPAPLQGFDTVPHLIIHISLRIVESNFDAGPITLNWQAGYKRSTRSLPYKKSRNQVILALSQLAMLLNSAS